MEAVDHELYAIVGEIGILLGIYLWRVQDKHWSYMFMPFDLFYEWGVIYQSQIAMEKEDVH